MARRDPPNIFSTSTVDLFASALGAAAILFVFTLTNQKSTEISAVQHATAFIGFSQFGESHLSGLRINLPGLSCKLQVDGNGLNSTETGMTCISNAEWNVQGIGSGDVTLISTGLNPEAKVSVTFRKGVDGSKFSGSFNTLFENLPVSSSFQLALQECESKNHPHFIELLKFDRKGLNERVFFWQEKSMLLQSLSGSPSLDWALALSQKILANPAFLNKIDIYAFESPTVNKVQYIDFGLNNRGMIYTNVASSAELKVNVDDIRLQLSNYGRSGKNVL